jgi:hypothetical protein
MKVGTGDRLLGSALKMRVRVLRNTKVLTEYGSQVYFVKTTMLSTDTVDSRRLAAKEVAIIYLSFTNVRVSIVVPGRGVSLEGGLKASRRRT